MVTRLHPVPARIFTREGPVSKVEIWNTFAKPGGGFQARAVVEARGVMGMNAIRYLIREYYATHYHAGGIEYWRLTPAGEDWLRKGAIRYAELHPERADEFNPPLSVYKPYRRIRRRV